VSTKQREKVDTLIKLYPKKNEIPKSDGYFLIIKKNFFQKFSVFFSYKLLSDYFNRSLKKLLTLFKKKKTNF